MHSEVLTYVAEVVEHYYLQDRSVFEIGSRDVNGSARQFFTGSYFGIDVEPGPGVDLVVDGADYHPTESYDVAICTEVFEHSPKWKDLLTTMALALRPGGVFIITCATTGRAPHSAIDGGALRDGEHYYNPSPLELGRELALYAFNVSAVVNDPGHGGDFYAHGFRKV